MIKLENVSKTYISETKQTVHALSEVSFELGSRGMVFILGKSGSGKSTLLNLLGGLDKPSDGEVIVDGVSMKNFSPTDYEAYRNGYVGFIFQEYNLLEDFNVRDNIALALQLSKGEDIDQKVTAALQQVELDEDYLTRLTDEMSGGEKQRVAIARAIVKDSKVILADEPTGNLDSMTGESVWNILKKLSEQKLVVVVTHDRESAEAYADRIIEIADGQIVSDSGSQPTDDNNVQFTPPKKGLSFKVCMKLAFNSIKQRKIRSASVALMSILCILALLVVQMCLTFSPEKTIARLINNNDVPYFTVSQGGQGEYYNLDGINDLDDFLVKFQTKGKLKQDTLNYIDGNCNYIVDGVVENKQQLLDFGLTFVGEALELDENSFYMSKQDLDKCFEQAYKIEYMELTESGWEYRSNLTEEQRNVQFLLGKRVDLYDLGLIETGSAYAVFAGAIDTDKIPSVSRGYFSDIFAQKGFKYWTDKHAVRIGRGSVASFGQWSLSSIGFDAIASNSMYCKTALMFEKKSDTEYETVVKSASELTLANDEIVLSAGLLAALLDENNESIYDYVDTSTGEIKKIPDIIKEPVPLRFYNYVTDELEADYGKYKVVGIEISNTTSFDVIFSDEKLTDIYLMNNEEVSILVQTQSVKNLTKFLTTLRNSYDGYVSGAGTFGTVYSDEPYEISQDIYAIEKKVVMATVFVAGIGLLFLIVLILLVINLISFSIVDRKKEIGVLAALGTSNRDLAKIFLLETLFISVITLVLTLVMASVASFVLSKALFDFVTTYISILSVDVLTVATAIVTSVGFLTLAALIPLRKIGKLNPVDAIRDN